MAIKVRSQQPVRAVKKFTDRKVPSDVFWSAYNSLKNNIENGCDDVKVITYYGLGGIGKSRLIQELYDELDIRQKNDNMGCCVKVDFSVINTGLDTIRHIQKVLRTKYNFRFPLYALGLTKRVQLLQNGEVIEENQTESIFGETTDDVMDMVGVLEWFPGLDLIPKVCRIVQKSANTLASKYEKHILQEEVDKIDKKKSIPEIESMLPYLLAKDIQRNVVEKKIPLVIFMDTYEKLVNEFDDIGYSYLKDEWLKGEEGIIRYTPNTLWVIAGREKLKWEEHNSEWNGSLEQHLMEMISEADVIDYFETAKIPKVLHHDLYKKTNGVPLLLDLSVDTYYKIKENGNEPTIDMFGDDEKKILERYVRYMDSDYPRVLYKMAFLRQWPRNDNRALKNNISHDFDALEESSCVQKIDDMNVLNPVVGEYLRKACKSELKNSICKELIDYFRQGKKVIHNDVYRLTSLVQISLDYLEANEIEERWKTSVYPDLEQLIRMKDPSAVKICKMVYDILNERFAGPELLKLHVMSLYGLSLNDFGHYQKACDLYKVLLSLCMDSLGEFHRFTIGTETQLANSLNNQGRYSEAFELRKKVYLTLTQCLGDTDPDTIEAMTNLAVSLSDLGKHQESISLNQKILEFYKNNLGDDDQKTIGVMHNLAISLYNVGRKQEAFKLRQAVLDAYNRKFGEENPNTIDAMHNLVNSLNDMGQYQKAMDMAQKVLDFRRHSLGDEHPDTIKAMHILAKSLSGLGDNQNALKLRAEVLELCKKVLGDNHPKTLLAMSNYADSLKLIGQHDNALKIREKVLCLCRNVFGDSHPVTINSNKKIIDSLCDMGLHERALELEKEVVELCKHTWGMTHMETLQAKARLANHFCDQKKYQEALDLRKSILDACKHSLGNNHPTVIMAMNDVASTLKELGRYEESYQLYDKTLQLSKSVLGENNPHTIMIMGNTAIALNNIGKHADALAMKECIIERCRNNLGENHPVSTMIMKNEELNRI